MFPNAPACRNFGSERSSVIRASLEMVTRHRLVVDQRAKAELRQVLRPQGNLKDAGTRRVERRDAVLAAR
jgi:hypothetical protein